MCISIFCDNANGQGGDLNVSNLKGTVIPKSLNPEIFSSGFVDIMNNGQINASARLIKLYIGEQRRFSIPISFYSRVSNNNFQQQTPTFTKSNDHLVNHNIPVKWSGKC